MQTVLSLLIIGIALSLDTFSLSLSLATYFYQNKVFYFFPYLVGSLHFILPLIGLFLGQQLQFIIAIDYQKLLGIIFLFLTIKLLYDYFHPNSHHLIINSITLLLLALSVSLDSFSVGIGLKAITSYHILPSCIFSLISFLFTLFGLKIGQNAYKNLGKIANIFGIIILIMLSIVHLCK